MDWTGSAEHDAQSRGATAEALRGWTRAAEQAHQEDRPLDEAEACVAMAHALLRADQLVEATSWANRALAALGDRAAPRLATGARLCLAIAHVERQQLAQALRQLLAAEVSSASLHRERAEVAWTQARIAVARGLPDAERSVAAALPPCAPFEDLHGLVQILSVVHQARSGTPPQDLRATLAEALRGLTGQARAEGRLLQAEAELAWGLPRTAARCVREVLAWADEHGHRRLSKRAGAVLNRVEHYLASTNPRVQRLLTLATTLTLLREPDELLQAVAAGARAILEADRAFVVLDGRVVASDGADAGERPSQSVVERCLVTGTEVVELDLEGQSNIERTDSLTSAGVRSVLCAPLRHRGHTTGVVYVDSRHAAPFELAESASLLRALAGQAGVAVANARQILEHQERQAQSRELIHDLRNLLTVVSVNADSLVCPGGEEAVIVKDIQDAAHTAVAQLRQVTGSAPSVEADLTDVTRNVVRLHRKQIEREAIRVELDAGEALWVAAQPLDIGRTVSNMLTNALKYGPAGSTVRIVLRRDGGVARWSIRDHGPGLPEDEIDTLFELGVQGPGAMPGTGVGLAVCRRIVEEVGGTLTGTNAPDGGAVFELTLPLVEGR